MAVFFFAPLPEVRFGRLRFLMDMIIHTASWGMILWFLLIEPILSPVRVSMDMRFWIALYSILDLVLLMLVVWLQGQAVRPSRALWWLAGRILPAFRPGHGHGVDGSARRRAGVRLYRISDGRRVRADRNRGLRTGRGG